MTCGTLYIFFMRFFLKKKKKKVLFLKIPMETSGLGFQGHPQLCISEFTWPHQNSPSGSFFLCAFGRVYPTTKFPKREEMSQLVVCRVVGAHPFHWKPRLAFWRHRIMAHANPSPQFLLMTASSRESHLFAESKPAHSPLALPDVSCCA